MSGSSGVHSPLRRSVMSSLGSPPSSPLPSNRVSVQKREEVVSTQVPLVELEDRMYRAPLGILNSPPESPRDVGTSSVGTSSGSTSLVVTSSDLNSLNSTGVNGSPFVGMGSSHHTPQQSPLTPLPTHSYTPDTTAALHHLSGLQLSPVSARLLDGVPKLKFIDDLVNPITLGLYKYIEVAIEPHLISHQCEEVKFLARDLTQNIKNMHTYLFNRDISKTPIRLTHISKTLIVEYEKQKAIGNTQGHDRKVLDFVNAVGRTLRRINNYLFFDKKYAGLTDYQYSRQKAKTPEAYGRLIIRRFGLPGDVRELLKEARCLLVAHLLRIERFTSLTLSDEIRSTFTSVSDKEIDTSVSDKEVEAVVCRYYQDPEGGNRTDVTPSTRRQVKVLEKAFLGI